MPFPLAQTTAPTNNPPVFLLFAGAIALLVSVLASARAFFSDDDLSPTRRALAHWLPVAATAAVATLLGQTPLAIFLLFGTSVAALSAVTGFVTMAGPMTDLPPRPARIWAFLPAAATLAFVLGFRGTLSPLDALLLLAQSVLACMVWRRTPDESPDWPDPLPRTAEPTDPDRATHHPSRPLRLVQALAALLLAVVGAYAAVRGAGELATRDYRYASGGVAALLLSLVLALPMVSTGVPLATAGRTWAPLTAQVGFVFLNLTVALPLVILTAGLRPWLKHYLDLAVLHTTSPWHGAPTATTAATLPATAPTSLPALAEQLPLWTEVLYPRTVWRIDALVLLCLSLSLIPASMGKLRLDRQVGGWLTVGYCLYLLALLVTSTRP